MQWAVGGRWLVYSVEESEWKVPAGVTIAAMTEARAGAQVVDMYKGGEKFYCIKAVGVCVCACPCVSCESLVPVYAYMCVGENFYCIKAPCVRARARVHVCSDARSAGRERKGERRTGGWVGE